MPSPHNLPILPTAPKALSVDPYDPLDMRNIGGSLVAAGDVSKQKQCWYYKEAQEIYERVAKVLNNKQITMLGKSYPIDPNSRQFAMGGRTFSVESMARDNETAMRNVSVKLKDRCMVSANEK